MVVWLVEDTEYNKEIVDSAEKAYNIIKGWIEEEYDAPEDEAERNEMLQELNENYKLYPNGFWVDDYAWADVYKVG